MSQNPHTRYVHRGGRRWRVAASATFLVFALGVAAPVGALANHADPLPSTLEGVVCGFASDLDLLLSEFDQQVGDFEEARLNRALVRARGSVTAAQTAATIPDLTSSLRSMKAAMRELEKGAGLGASGSGFADDLASLGSFYVEVFVGDLIEVATSLGAADAGTLAEATSHFNDGELSRNAGEWEDALSEFLRAVREMDGLSIGPPCV